MGELLIAVLQWIREEFGTGSILAIAAIGGSGWVAWKAKAVLDEVAASMRKVADSLEETSRILQQQQSLCRNHQSSQQTLVEAMTSLVNEVHISTTSGNRVQETNMRAVLDLLERQLDRNAPPSPKGDV